MVKNNMVSVKKEVKLQEELISDYYKSLYGQKEDKIRLQQKIKHKKMSKLKSKFSKKRSKKKK